MHRRTIAAAASALASIAFAVPALSQDKSKQIVPLFLEGEAAALAAKMLFICGGGSGGTATGPVRFTMTVKKAEPGETLTLSAGGIPQASVTATAKGTARFLFGANGAPGLPLDFDPRETEIEVENEGGSVLSSRTTTGALPDGARVDERAGLAATGAIPGASGHARLRERRGMRDFDVEIEDVPDGAYDLVVDGTIRGTIAVAAGEGDIEFSTGGDDADELPLDFEPLGALVQVAQGGTVVLSGTMLAAAGGVSVCTPSESRVDLASSGIDPDASGDTRFRVRDDCDRDFRVEIEDVPVGAYDLFVGGVLRGTIEVLDLGLGEIEGEIEFDTDADEPGELLLDFDPVGQEVEVRQGGTLFFSSTVGDPGPGTCDPIEVEPSMTSTGADADADGKARFRQEGDCDRDFRVEVEDLPVGTYTLVVDGVTRGSIAVADVGGGDVEGDIEFDNDPDQTGELLLDFDPRGLVVEVRQGSTVFLHVTMPG